MSSSNHGPGPQLSLENFDSWKIRMQEFLASVSDEMIDVITIGPIVPKKVNTALGPGAEQMVDKPKDQWDSSDRKRGNLDAVCKNIFIKCWIM